MQIVIYVLLYLLSLPLAIYIINTIVHGLHHSAEITLRQLGIKQRNKANIGQDTMVEDAPDIDFFELPPPPEDDTFTDNNKNI